MITVLIATGIMNAGGAETLIMEMLRHRSSRIKYILLIHHNGSPIKGVYDEEISKMNIPMVYIPSIGCIGMKQYCEVFKEKIKTIGYIDVLHLHLNAIGGIISKAAKEAGIKNRIIHSHADITYTGQKLSILMSETKLALLKKYVNHFGTDFWACSEAAGKRLFKQNRTIKIIPNVIDVEKYLPAKEKHDVVRKRLGFTNQLVLGSVGRIAPIKNYEFVFRVLSTLKKRGVSVCFVCFGREIDAAYFASLTELAEKLDVSDCVHFMGNSNNIPEDIAGLDVFLMPSKSEGFGMAAIEAQAAGIPAIVSTGVPTIVDVGLGLIQFLPFETEQWANAIEKAGMMVRPSNENIIKAFDQHGFNSPTAVKNIEAEYIKMMGNQRG